MLWPADTYVDFDQGLKPRSHGCGKRSATLLIRRDSSRPTPASDIGSSRRSRLCLNLSPCPLLCKICLQPRLSAAQRGPRSLATGCGGSPWVYVQ